MGPASIIQHKILVAHIEDDMLYAHRRHGSRENLLYHDALPRRYTESEVLHREFNPQTFIEP